MDADYTQKYYVFLRNTEAWSEGEDDFAKFLEDLKRADEKDLEVALVEVSIPYNYASCLHTQLHRFLADPLSNWNFLPHLFPPLITRCQHVTYITLLFTMP